MTRRKRALRSDAQQNRAELLAVGAAAFAELGLDAPVSEIARRAGVAKGTFFRHFPTKDALISAILADHYVRLRALLERIEASRASGVEALVEYMLAAGAQLAPDRSFWHAAHSAGADSAEIHAASKELDAGVGRLLRRAQREGTVRGDISAIDIQTLITAATSATAPLAAVRPNLWRRYLELMIDALRAPATTPLSVPALSVEDFPKLMAQVRADEPLEDTA
jgi:AcrR family transcriptional regulator